MTAETTDHLADLQGRCMLLTKDVMPRLAPDPVLYGSVTLNAGW